MVLAFTTSKLIWREGHCWRELIAEQRVGAPRVAILDTIRRIGQPLDMLTKMNSIYDVVNVPGVSANISHMDTRVVVRGFLRKAFTGVDLVIIPAGGPRMPGMTWISRNTIITKNPPNLFRWLENSQMRRMYCKHH